MKNSYKKNGVHGLTRIYSEKEKQYMAANYGKMSMNQISKDLNISYCAVRNWMIRNGYHYGKTCSSTGL